MATAEAPLYGTTFEDDGTYAVVLSLWAPKALLRDHDVHPDNLRVKFAGRSVRVARLRIDREAKQAVLELEIETPAWKMGGDPAPASVSWGPLIAAIVSALIAGGALVVGAVPVAIIFGVGFAIASVTMLVRGDPGADDDLKLKPWPIAVVLVAALGLVLVLQR
jgi:hypothetical protein